MRGPLAAVPIPTPHVPAGTTAAVDLPPVIHAQLTDTSPLALTLTARTRSATTWAPAGTEITTHQVVLPRAPEPFPDTVTTHAPVDDTGDLAHPLLRRSPRLCLWRAPTDNDSSFLLDNRFVRSGFFQLHMSDVDIRDSAVTTRYEAAFGDEVIHRRTIRTIADGDFLLTEHVTLPPETRDGLRVGVEFELIDGFERAAWVGLGPWENYPDRRASALLGAWESAIDDLAVPYLLPQENGTRGDVTELRLTGAPGVVRTVHATPLHVNVSRHTTRELENATHWWQLPRQRTTVVHLDIAHRGVGTGRLGPDTRRTYRLDGTEYTWQWRLSLTPA